MVCLDTDVIIGLMHNQPEAKKFFQSCRQEKEPFKTTSFSVYELFKGAYKVGETDADTVERILAEMEILYPSIVSARIFGKQYQKLRQAGRMASEGDLAIASVCLAENEFLVTRNTKDFERIEGLKLKKW